MLIHPYSDTHGHQHEICKHLTRLDFVINTGDFKANKIYGCRLLECLGNHDFYNKNINDFNLEDFRKISIIDDYVFLGCTLWTDFWGGCLRLDEYQMLNDFHLIEGMGVPLMKELYKKDLAFLKKNVKKYNKKKIVIYTHFPPSKKAIHPKYEGDRLNRYFVNDLDDFILSNPQIKLWIFGHTHTSHDFKIGECRCLCNPRGYQLKDGTFENPDFDPNLIVEI